MIMLFTIDHIELWRWRQKLHLRVFPGKLESDGLESVEKRPLWGSVSIQRVCFPAAVSQNW